MKREHVIPALRWVIYALLLLLLYGIQTAPGMLVLFGVKPVLILSLAVCIAMFEPVLPAALFCMTAGLLWDISSDKLFGFNGLILLFCGLFISLFCIYYFHTRLFNAFLFCAAAALVQGLLDYLFYYALWSFENAWIILVRGILPTALYTVAATALIFPLVQMISHRLSPAHPE